MKNAKLARASALALAALMLSLWLPANVSAVTLTWTGGYGGANGPIWNNSANWGGTAFVENSDIVLAGSVQPDTYLGGDHSVTSITFTNSTDLFIIGLRTAQDAAANLTFNSTNTGITIFSKNKNAQRIGNLADLGVVILENNLLVKLNSSAPLYFVRPVTGPFGITKSGPGSLYLMGANTYSGDTTINAGLLVMASQSTGGGTVTVKDGAAFGVDRDTPYVKHTRTDPTLDISSLTLGSSAGAKIRFYMRDGNSVVPTLSISNLTLNGNNQIEIEGGNFTIGQFPLLKYTTKTGTGSFATTLNNLPWGIAATIVNNTANKTIDLSITAIPPNRSRAQTAIRLDEGYDYVSNPDLFPVCKAGNDLMMHYTQVPQRVFNTCNAIIEDPWGKTNAYPAYGLMSDVYAYEARGWNASVALVYREAEDYDHAGYYFEEDKRVLSPDELATLRGAVGNRDIKLIQLLLNAPGFSTFSPELMAQLLRFDGVGVEAHVGDSTAGSIRLEVLEQMAVIAKWSTDNGKTAFTFMGGNEGTYEDLPGVQHTYTTLWRMMLAQGVDYRAANMIYMRQGSRPGSRVPESNSDTLSYQQQWVIQALKDTSLFISTIPLPDPDPDQINMRADTLAQVVVVAGKAEAEPLTYTATSSNPALVSNVNLSFSGRRDGLDHIFSIKPNPGQTGEATITLNVSDGVDTKTKSLSLTVTPLVPVSAVTNGWINDSNTWGGNLPVAGDLQTWRTGTRAVNMSGAAIDTFLGGTLEVQTGGALVCNEASAELKLQNLTLSGGTISMNNGGVLLLDLQGNQFTLNSGTLKSGPGSGRDIRIVNTRLAGSGTINIIGSPNDNSQVDFAEMTFLNRGGVKYTMGFSGIFNVYDHGRLNLPCIIPDKASFGIKVTGTGVYINDEDVAVMSLVLGTDTIPPGTYRRADFTPAQQAFIDSNVGTITVVTNLPPTISPIADQTNTVVVAFTVGDAETPASLLTVTGASSNTNLVPNSAITFDGSGSNRTVTLSPVANQTGATTITITVSDGILTTNESFTYTVTSADTDGDGMQDADEFAIGRNPFSAADLGFEFNTDGDFEGWETFARITNRVVSGGAISGTSTTLDPYFSSSGFNFDGNRVSNIVVKIRLPAPDTVQFFWGRVGATAFSSVRRVEVPYTASNAWQLVTFPLATNAEWRGQTITSLRVDPGMTTARTFAIDWIRAMDGDPNVFKMSSAAFTNGLFSMSINGQAGMSYVVQTSTNLTTWLPVWTNSSSLPPYLFTDSTTNFNRRFYRVLLGP